MKNPLANIHFHDRHTQKEKKRKNNKSKSKGGASFITFSTQQKSVFSGKMKKGNLFFFCFCFLGGKMVKMAC